MKLHLLLFLMSMPQQFFARKQIVKKKKKSEWSTGLLWEWGAGVEAGSSFWALWKPGSSIAKVKVICSCLQQCRIGERRKSWVSEPILPSEQNLLWAGAGGIQWRTWLYQAAGLLLPQLQKHIFLPWGSLNYTVCAASSYLCTA